MKGNIIKEFCLFVNNPEALFDIPNIEEWYINLIKQRCLDFKPYIINYIEDVLSREKFTRLYIGAEFCQDLLLDEESLTKICHFCKKQGYFLTLVTPPINDEGLDILKKLLDLTKAYTILNFEVVCNNWGVIGMLHREFSNIPLIAGRTLDKTVKEFRYTKNDLEKMYTKEGELYLSSIALLSDFHKLVLEKYNINRCEIDAVLQGRNIENTKMDISLYLPYTFISTGRQCAIHAAMSKQKFILKDTCNQYCKNMYHLTSYTNTKSGRNIPLYKKGNTIFQYAENFNDILNNSYVNRIVFEV